MKASPPSRVLRFTADISFKDDVTVLLLLGVSSMNLALNN